MLLTVVFGGGCDRDPAKPAGQPPAEVRVGYFANLTHAQAMLGVQDGTFAAALGPSKLSTKIFNAGPSVIEALFADEIDIAYIGPGPAINGFVRSNGEGLRVIAGSAANGVVIVAAKDSGISTLADLKDKRIATPQHGNTQDIAARIYVTQKLGQADHKNVTPVANAEQLGMLSRGQIDAAWSPEPWASRLVAEAGAKVIAEESSLWPGGEFSLTLVITTPKFLKEHPDAVEKFLAAHVDLTRRLQNASDADLALLNDALEKLTGKRIGDAVLRTALGRTKFTTRPLDATLTTMADWSFALGFLPKQAKLDGFVDLSLLERVEAGKPQPATRPAGGSK
jgi:NitT/TauT family transport system substrate-binding protein